MNDGAQARFLPALALLLGVSLLLMPTWRSLAVSWTDVVNLGYTHGYLILALSGWLLYRRRREFVVDRRPPPAVGVPAMLLAALLWLFAYRASIEIGYELLLPCILEIAVVNVFGWRAARASAFPIGYLYFAIPVWDYLMGPLQSATIASVEVILRMLGVPLHIEDNLVTIPEGRFEIAGGCGGLHFFIVALSLAALVGELRLDSWRRRIYLMAIAAIFALLANWSRVSIIIMAGHLTNMRHPLITVGHYYFGWWVFAGFMSVYFLIAARLPDSAATMGERAPAVRPAVGVAPRIAAVLGVLLLVVAWGAATSGDAAAKSLEPPLPTSASGWHVDDGWPVTGDEWKPSTIGADLERRYLLTSPEGQVRLYWAAYASQRQGKELINEANSISSPYKVMSSDIIDIAGDQSVAQIRVQSIFGSQSLLWYVYYVGDRRLTTGIAAQISYGVRSLAGPARAAVLALQSECDGNCDVARRRLTHLVAALQTGTP